MEFKCRICSALKPASEYRVSNGYRRTQCKACGNAAHHEWKQRKKKDAPLCACGCGQQVKAWDSRFILGHQCLKLATSGPKLKKQKRCHLCHELKPASAFRSYEYTTNQGKRSRRLDSRCKPCDRKRSREERKRNDDAKRQRERRAANPERFRERDRNYNRGNPKTLLSRLASEYKRRARQWRNDVGPGRQAVERTLEAARIGDKYLDAYTGELIDKPTVDHVTPLSLGGSNEDDNLCVTSVGNNSSKHDDLLIVWLAKRAKRFQNTTFKLAGSTRPISTKTRNGSF